MAHLSAPRTPADNGGPGATRPCRTWRSTRYARGSGRGAHKGRMSSGQVRTKPGEFRRGDGPRQEAGGAPTDPVRPGWKGRDDARRGPGGGAAAGVRREGQAHGAVRGPAP
ncbi:hypothetical protein GCM10027168_55700 [Streptomyces capparidis]